MAGSVSRREFLRIAGVGTAAAATAGSWALARHVKAADATLPTPHADTVIPTFCEICFWKCGVLAHVQDGRVWKLTGNPRDPLCEGRLCPRGTGGLGALYDPDRLASPLLRVRERGQERWREASWKEALEVVAEKMLALKRQYGPESVALLNHGTGGAWFGHLLKAFGSPNNAQPSYAQCRGPRDAGFELTFGEGIGSPERYDLRNTRYLVLIGSHLGENMHNSQVQDFADLVGRGARLVVVDPRFSVAASKAERWLPIRPGTDLALLLAWIHVLLAEELYDRDYVQRYTIGLEELRAAVAGYTPEWAYPVTGIEAETIRAVARDMARHKPAVLLYPGRHVTWYGDDTQRTRAMAILAALLGSWGQPGGFYIPSRANVPAYPTPGYPKAKRGYADGSGTTYPFANEGLANGLRDATRTGRPYPIKGWIVYGTNLIQSLPNTRETVEAIRKLDLLVAIDTMPSEITGWADVVLPECTYLERYDELSNGPFHTPFIALRQPVVPPMYDSKPGWWIARELGHRLGLGAYFPWKDIEQYLDTRLRGAGFSLAELKEKGTVTVPASPLYLDPGRPAAFPTPSGKIELASSALAKAGFDAVPRYTPPQEPPQGFFRLLYGRAPVHTFGRTTNNPLLAEAMPDNEVWINVDAAQELGIENGEPVVLVNQDNARSAPIRAKVTQRIRTDCVYMVHGFGHTARRMRRTFGKGADDTGLITRYATDPLMGGTGMRVNFVRVERADAQ